MAHSRERTRIFLRRRTTIGSPRRLRVGIRATGAIPQGTGTVQWRAMGGIMKTIPLRIALDLALPLKARETINTTTEIDYRRGVGVGRVPHVHLTLLHIRHLLRRHQPPERGIDFLNAPSLHPPRQYPTLLHRFATFDATVHTSAITATETIIIHGEVIATTPSITGPRADATLTHTITVSL